MKFRHPTVAAILSWLVPGLGQIYQGRVLKGLLLSVTVLSTFFWGMHLGEWKVVYWTWDDERRPVVEAICRLGVGLAVFPSYAQSIRESKELPYLGTFQAAPSEAELYELNARLNSIWDIAKVYTMLAGLLNVLVIIDAFAGPALERSTTQKSRQPGELPDKAEPRETESEPKETL